MLRDDRMRNANVETVRFAPLKAAIVKLIASPAVGWLIGFLFRDRIPSHSFYFDTHGKIDPRVKAHLLWGIYERAEIRFIRNYLRTDIDVVELGSSIGVLSTYIMSRLRNGKRLVCVEANPDLIGYIHRNLELNRLEGATVVTAAVSYLTDKEGIALFRVGDTNLDSSLASMSGAENGNTIRVTGCTLRELLDKFQLDDFALVCDIEGEEIGIFLHDAHALARCRQMVIELHETQEDAVNYTVEDLIDLVTYRHGFELRARRGPVCVFDRPRLSPE
jgi:FkbM family methyltransferase